MNNSKLIDARSDQSSIEMKDNPDRIPSPPPIVRVRGHDIFSLEHFDLESSVSTVPGMMVDVPPLVQGKFHPARPRVVPPFPILSAKDFDYDHPPTMSNLTEISSDQYYSMGGHSHEQQGHETAADTNNKKELKQQIVACATVMIFLVGIFMLYQYQGTSHDDE